MEQNTVAIVCGGGPAPGINSVISAVTIEADKNVITEQKFEKGKDVQIEGNGADGQNTNNNMSRNNNSNSGNNLAEPLK